MSLVTDNHSFTRRDHMSGCDELRLPEQMASVEWALH